MQLGYTVGLHKCPVLIAPDACDVTGNFGQTNYSAAKMGLVGFTKTLAREGEKYNIRATAIAPVSPLYWPGKIRLIISKMAASAMTETVMPPEMLANIKVRYVHRAEVNTLMIDIFSPARICRTVCALRDASFVPSRCLRKGIRARCWIHCGDQVGAKQGYCVQDRRNIYSISRQAKMG